MIGSKKEDADKFKNLAKAIDNVKSHINSKNYIDEHYHKKGKPGKVFLEGIYGTWGNK